MNPEWLNEKISLEEAEQDLHALDYIPDESWSEFVAQMQDDDQLWWFTNTQVFGDPSTDAAGYAIVRNGKIVRSWRLVLQWETLQ